MHSGWHVTGIVRSEKQKNRITAQFPQNLIVYVADLSNRKQVQSIVSKI